MDVVDISRWQFGITTVYHFIFVPLTIGLAPLVALMQTLWLATKLSLIHNTEPTRPNG